MKRHYLLTTTSPDSSHKLPPIVTATDATGPFGDIASLHVDLKNQLRRGEVLFDTILSNGSKSRRFFRAFFNGESIDNLSLIDDPNEVAVLRKASAKVINENEHLFDFSHVSPAQSFCIKRGII